MGNLTFIFINRDDDHFKSEFLVLISLVYFLYWLYATCYGSALLDSENDLFRRTEEGWGPMSEEIDIRELKDEVSVLLYS